MSDYIAVVHKAPNSDFGVSFPDFPGCITAGTTLDEAKAMAQEALSLHIRGIMEDGHSLPTPSKFEAVAADPDYSDATAYLIVSDDTSAPSRVTG